MSRRQKDPLRPLSQEERARLEQLSRSRGEAASHVTRAKALLAVADGQAYTDAARQVGYALGHGGGPKTLYSAQERQMILAEARRTPEREQDGTATWSLTTLQRSLRAKGLTHVSTYTIWCVLREAGLPWQKNRAWCDTGTALRKRERGVVVVTDPDAEAKKT